MTTRTTAKHTPGKWTASAMKDGSKPCGHRVIADGYQLAHCMTYGNTATLAETEANAHLIAAAPDLLAACKLFRDQLAKFGQEHPQYGGWAGLLCTADKAIASAEGR